MSIDRVNISNQGIDRSQAAQQAELTRTASKNQKVSGGGSDSVELSSKAGEMNRLANTVDQSRTDRLNQVRSELEAGTYKVSAKDVAQKLIDANTK
jgi:negative regulator of flagellin synthesis FlgM